MPSTITTLADLQKSAVTYQQQLVQMPVIGAQDTLRHMRPYPGILGRHVLTEISGSFDVGPYKRSRWADGAVTLTPRVLETYLGNNAVNFDPNELYGTIFGERIFKGEGIKSGRVAAEIVLYLAARLGKTLNMAIWSAKRNEAGDATTDLFDGFDTITDNEVKAGTVAAAKGNFTQLTEEITDVNAVDQLQAIYDGLSDELQGQAVNIYLSKDIYRKYLKDYKQTTGAIVYNDKYEQLTLEGSDGLATFVPLVSKKGSQYIHIAPKQNLCYGFGGGIAGETVSVEKYKPWEFTLEAAYAFGVQFASVSPEVFHAVKLKAAAAGGGTTGK